MNTEYAVGKIRIGFESRARRRKFVALLFAVLAAIDVAAFYPSAKNPIGAWIITGCLFLFIALWIVFTWVAGDMRARGDEREVHRRDHAHFRAYHPLGMFLAATLVAEFSFSGPHPITSLAPVALHTFLLQLPSVLLMATFLLYLTLPQAILLWTEPDMEQPEQAS